MYSSYDLVASLGPLAEGAYYGGIAHFCTSAHPINPKTAALYAVSNVLINEAVYKIATEVFQDSPVGRVVAGALAISLAINGGMEIANRYGYKIDFGDVLSLGINSLLIQIPADLILQAIS